MLPTLKKKFSIHVDPVLRVTGFRGISFNQKIFNYAPEHLTHVQLWLSAIYRPRWVQLETLIVQEKVFIMAQHSLLWLIEYTELCKFTERERWLKWTNAIYWWKPDSNCRPAQGSLWQHFSISCDFNIQNNANVYMCSYCRSQHPFRGNYF